METESSAPQLSAVQHRFLLPGHSNPVLAEYIPTRQIAVGQDALHGWVMPSHALTTNSIIDHIFLL